MSDHEIQRRSTDLAIRLAVLALLAYWCFAIVKPFLIAIVLGIVIAISLYPVYAHFERWTRGRRKTAAGLMVLACLVVLMVPTLLMFDSLVDGVRLITAKIHEGNLTIPPAPQRVADWPLVGRPIYDAWTMASTNLDAVLQKIQPQLTAVGLWLVTLAKQGVGAALIAAIGLVIAGVLWVRREPSIEAATVLGRRIGGDRGASLIPLAGKAIATVAKGVVGVAAIQATASAIGMMAAGIPGAGLWSLLILVLAVAQLPAIIILGPAVLYLVATSDSTITIVLFIAWAAIISVSDNILKPLLMGRGSDIPVLVILIGAIGGMILHGLIGLFVGAVVFSIGYTLITEWMRADAAATAP